MREGDDDSDFGRNDLMESDELTFELVELEVP